MSKVFARFHSRNRVLTSSILAVAFVLLAAKSPAIAQSAPRPEALIKWRQSAFQVIAWNSSRIKAAVASGDSQEVRAAAAALSGVANSGLHTLFPANTAQGKGWRETTARAEVFSDPERFRALTLEFARESSELARLAVASDQAATTAQFAKVAKTCKSCHDKFRQTD
jgi:cytochrome c556